MTIHAQEKFMGAIVNSLVDFRIASQRNITDPYELQKIMQNLLSNDYAINWVNPDFTFVKARATEFVYENGLIYLDSALIFRNHRGVLKNIHKTVVTPGYNEIPLVSMDVTQDRKNISQFLLETESSLEIYKFPLSERNIEIKEISISIEGIHRSSFETYKNLEDETMLVERYKPYKPMPLCDDSSKGYIQKGDVLEILYRRARPIYAQLVGSSEQKGFDPNSLSHAAFIVDKVVEEVDVIRDEIYEVTHKFIQKNEKEDKKSIVTVKRKSFTIKS